MLPEMLTIIFSSVKSTFLFILAVLSYFFRTEWEKPWCSKSLEIWKSSGRGGGGGGEIVIEGGGGGVIEEETEAEGVIVVVVVA